MRAQRFRLPARLSLAAILASLAIPGLGIAGQAKSSDIILTVHVGYQDVIKPGAWMPVTVDAKNTGAGIDGTIEIQESLNGQPGTIGLTVYDQPISLAGGATKRIRMYAGVETTGITISARILQDGRVIASQDASPGGTTSALIGVLSDESTAFDEFAAIHPGGISARVVHLRADELAESAIPLRAFDILAINDFATDGLTARQRAAIADYVNAGGDLLLGTGAAWHKTLAGLPASLLPMQISGTTVLDSTALGASAVELATGSLTQGKPWLSQSAGPLLVERSVGSGMVTMATFDWMQQPLAINVQTQSVMRQVMARTFFGPGGSAQNFAYGMGGGPGFGFGSQPSVASKSGALTPVLGNLPGLDLPSLQVTGVLVLLYVLIVGPLNYIVLGAMHRRALAWVTVPVIAVVAAAGAYGAGVFTKGRSVQINQVAILHIQPGWDHAYQEVYTGVIPPSRGDYHASIAGEGLLISPISNTGGFNGSNSSSGLKVNVASNDVTLPGMTAFSLGGFATESIASAPALSAHLRLVNGLLTGTIENHSSISFTDAVVIAGDSYQTIPALKPGATANVSLTPKAVNAFGQPLFSRIYGSNYYGGPNGGGPNPTGAARDQFAKSQILSLLPLGIGFKGITSTTAPLFVGWTHDAVQSVAVNGAHPRSTAMSAVALSLSVDQIGAGTLPGGVVVGRIVDVVGDSSGNGPPGMLMLQNGSVTYEFAPQLAPGTHLSGVSVSAVNPYGPKFGGPSGGSSPSVSGQVWDWAHGTWVDLAYQDNGTTSIPDNAIDPSSGTIRLRVSTTNSAFLAGTITLSGTVQ
ncbi:MAG TPA: hypothetical protein VFR68_05105 [Candidatus Dormibacteraeota bacterium]|nr:hypothetical protein [Candidatus Dormibacteraeota bacterium]